ATNEPTTADDAREALATRAADFDEDGTAAGELREFAVPLGLDPDDEDYSEQAAAALLVQPAGTFSGTAASFRSLGVAIASAADGALLPEEALRLERELLLAANRTGEIGLLGCR